MTLLQFPLVASWRRTRKLARSISQIEAVSIWLAYTVRPSLVNRTSTAPCSPRRIARRLRMVRASNTST
ncbi:MAG TPA: hypothetical protein VG499_17110, partial [Actinomycetota bacterium]|nr:hypothetical protein [Actinomycetota bacterium]